MTHKRESYKHFIGVDEADEKAMLTALGLNSLDDLFSHLRSDIKLAPMKMENGLPLDKLRLHMKSIADRNHIKTSFIGDGLQDFVVPDIVEKVCSIRGLTTAYTPYQPERSQGTLQTLWIYQNLISKITGFEAINSSLYERSTCLFEALSCTSRIKRNKNTVLVSKAIYPGDIDVLETIAKETELVIRYIGVDKKTGLTDLKELTSILKENSDIAGFAFPQVNTFGLVENFNDMTDIAHEHEVLAIALVDLQALANKGLKEPASWGADGHGADLLVAEGQPLTLAPNYGGPGLGIFGIRYNDKSKNLIRSTAGRFIGKTSDINGRDCKAIILATREQHIRREKATSNICSNQAFIASACGAALLEKGNIGIDTSFKMAHESALKLARDLTNFVGVDLLFNGPIFNEFVLKINTDVKELITLGASEGLHIGVDISKRLGLGDNLLKISVSDRHSTHDVHNLSQFFKKHFKASTISNSIGSLQREQIRVNELSFESHPTAEIYKYYKELGDQNLSPDDGIYPLGSCTMKYNPEINDWAAGLENFTQTHPQAPIEDVQGNMQLLFEVQELFKDITGLPGVTTQPVAGAQGELVGLKMFQAYHRDNSEGEARNIVLIPRSAHGTNPATATMAGFETKKVDGNPIGIITIEANDSGEIDFEQFKSLVEKYGKQISGIMITNPNTAGIFESNFKNIADLVHSVGGLVYMDGANMNAIAGHIDLNKLGVDAVHNNLHKTWSIPHGGGGPGDAIVAVSEKLMDYLPGMQITENNGVYSFQKPLMSIGSFHRHHGNFAHKVRAYTYLKALGADGIKRMSAVAVLNARYLYQKLNETYPVLPAGSLSAPRMHEFILTLSDESFERIAAAGTPKAHAIARVGKLFLDFGFHAPTVAFPEVYGLMIEPTESFSKSELDGFCEVVKSIHTMIHEYPQILQTVPHFTPVDRVDELRANKQPEFTEKTENLMTEILKDRVSADELRNTPIDKLTQMILRAHEEKMT